MSYRSAILLALLAVPFAGRVAAQGTPTPPKPQMTARELFYFSAPEAKDAGKPAPKSSGQNKGGSVTPSGTKQPKGTTTTASGKGTAGGGVKGPVTGAPKAPDGTPIIPAVSESLGLKYTILKRNGGQRLEVAAGTVFHTGDQIQLRVETNGPGYLYIVSQGPSGTWKPMFPAAEIGHGSNRVEANSPVTLPSEEFGMTFVEPAGKENITIVLSRQPVPDFEDLIYSLKDKSKPAAQPAETKKNAELLVADARIGDPTVERLRNLYSRDLIIEKVTPETPGERKETAVYVVNPAGGADSRLVADLHLVHQ